ncbi:hypothetical protein [Bacillus sp. SM2101]|uniref:hypothetical protein n=1 Tax=Bacillus sp. SM2101 TaxID=2805366 RepID=UPI001BDE7D04|nr:hypothetical protein [Bacillus sp. SM2101]
MTRGKLIGYLLAMFIAGMTVMALIANFNPLKKFNEFDYAMEKLERIDIRNTQSQLEDDSEILDIKYIADSYFYIETEKSQHIVRLSRAIDEEKPQQQGIFYEFYPFKSTRATASTRMGVLENLPVLDWVLKVPDTYYKGIEIYRNKNNLPE